MKHILYKMSVTIMFLFSIIGLTISINLVHEYSHKLDMKGLVYDDNICLLTLEWPIKPDSAIAMYSYTINSSNLQEYRLAKSTTEVKAFIIDITMILLFCVCMYTVGHRYKRLLRFERMRS